MRTTVRVSDYIALSAGVLQVWNMYCVSRLVVPAKTMFVSMILFAAAELLMCIEGRPSMFLWFLISVYSAGMAFVAILEQRKAR